MKTEQSEKPPQSPLEQPQQQPPPPSNSTLELQRQQLQFLQQQQQLQQQQLLQHPLYQPFHFARQQAQNSQRNTTPTTTNNPKITLKLILHKDTQKLLFAEAGKDFIDFLFSIPSLPIGSFLSLHENTNDDHQTMVNGDNQTMVNGGSLINVCTSIRNLSEHCMQPLLSDPSLRENLLFPVTPNNLRARLQSSRFTAAVSNSLAGMGLSYQGLYNQQQMNLNLGYVRGTMTYMVTDDLSVQPMSVISSVSYLDKFDALDIIKLDEKEVVVGKMEAVKLLKESMVTKNVLSAVFLEDNNMPIDADDNVPSAAAAAAASGNQEDYVVLDQVQSTV